MFTGPGAVLADDDNPPSVEAIRDALQKLSAMDTAREYSQLNEQIGDVLTAFTAPPPETTNTATGFGSAADVFAAMPGAFNTDAATGVDVVFQYNIARDLGGDWSCSVKDGTCTVDPGQHDSPVCTLKMDTADFLAMMNGTLPAMQAYTSGKLKIEGDIMKSQLIEKLFKF